jgi:adhesin/invasin
VSRSRAPILVLALGFGILSGCDKMSLVSPTGSTITLTINKTSVPINGTAEVTASVIESAGTPVQNGTVVTFTSSFGTIDPREARTEGGTARVIFTGTQSGIAKIGAFSGGAKTAADLEVRVGGAAAETLKVRAEPPTIPQVGGSAQIIVTVSDVSGSPLPNAPVLFTTDNGSLSPGASTTDANGEARTTLTTTRTSKVTATVAAKTGDVTVNLVNAPTVTITACSATPLVGVAVNCTITPTVPTGGSPIQGVTVTWGDGTPAQNLGAITGATVASHIYSRADNYTVTATATDSIGQRGTGSAAINVTRSLPTITVTASATTGFVGVPISFTVTPGANPTQPITNVTVNFGDGTSRNLGVISSAVTIAKSYGSEGTFTVTATITDQSGQQGNGATQVVIGRSASPTITFTQNGTVALGTTFTVSANVAAGLSLRSIVVTRFNNNAVVYNQTGGGTFYVDGIAATEVLTAVATDSAGNSSSFALVVK